MLLKLMLMLLLCTACAVNQSTDSQHLGRYLGFRLRCLDVDTQTHRPHPPTTTTTAAAAAGGGWT